MAEELEIPVADNETEQTNDPLGILSPKKQSDNSDPLGILKKKVGGNVSSNGTSNTAPSTSPSISDSQGRIFADNSFFKQIGQQTTPELQQRHDEILSRQKELNTQPKKPSILKKFDSMAAPILGFNRDLVQSINPKKVAEIDHDVNGHWGNIVQNVFAKIEKTGNDIAAGTLGLINDAEQLQNPIKSEATPLGYLIAGLNGNKKRLENVINNNQLPNTFLGNTVNSITSIAADIAGAALVPEAKIAQGAGILAKAGWLLFNKFTNYLIGKGVATGYGEAKAEGKTQGEAAIQALKGGAEGAKQGIELAILGAGSGLATKGIMAQAEKAGLTGAKGIATRQLVNLSTDLVAYGLVQPTINAAEEGRFPTMKEIADGAGIAAAFRIKGGVEELRNHTTLNKAIQETQNQRQGVAISNFVDADHDAIKQVYEQPETAQELNIKALEAAKKAKETTDLQKKQQYVAEAITYTKASNVKSVTDAVLNNPKGVEEIQNSDLPDQVKNQFVQKAQEITDLLKPKQEYLESTTVIKPEENIPAETTTIAPKEYTPETKKSGVKVILPKQEESEQQTTEFPKIEEPVSTPVSKEGSGSVDNPALKDVESTKNSLEGSMSNGKMGKILDKEGIKDIPISDIVENPNDKSFEDAVRKVKQGLGSRTKEPIIVVLKNDGKYHIRDGTHRVAEAMVNGDKTISANIEYDVDFNQSKNLARAYHKAKADGSNPELVKAVEDLIGKNETNQTEVSKPTETENPIVEEANKVIEQPKEGSEGQTNQKVSSRTNREEGQGKEPPIEPPTEQKGTEVTDSELTGITHTETDKVAKELGLPEYEKNPETVAEWDAEADKRIKKDPDSISKLLNKLKNNDQPDKIEQRMMAKYLASLKAKINSDPTNDKLINDYKNAKELSDKVGGREVGKSLVARKDLIPVEDSIGDLMVREMETLGVDKLTDKQKEDIVSDYNKIQEAQKETEAKLKILEEENAKLKAEAEFKKTTKSIPTQKKSKEDISKAREDIKQSIKDKWKKASNDGTLTAVPVPYAKQLAAIAPDVAKLVKSYVEEGVTELKEVVKKVLDDIKEYIPEITEKDVHDLIAGNYNEKKKTRNELSAKLKDLKDEAIYINKLEKLLNGEEPKGEKKKTERNRQIKELQDKIKDFKKSEVEANKFYGESETGNRKIEKMEDELQRLKDRKEKEPSTTVKKQLSEKEIELKQQIEEERKAFNKEKAEANKFYGESETGNRKIEKMEDELQRLKDRKEKEPSTTVKKQLSEKEIELKQQIEEERKAFNKEKAEANKFYGESETGNRKIEKMEDELQRLKDRKEKEPSTTVKKQLSEKEIELKQQIEEERKAFNKEKAEANKFYGEEIPSDIKALISYRKRLEAQANNIQDEINKGNYAPEPKKSVNILEDKELQKKYPKQYKEALEAKDKLIKLKQEREIKFLKQQYANRSKYDKTKDAALELINVPRALMSSFDFSAPLRQGIIPTVAHPKIALGAAKEMFANAFSQKRFDRYFHNLRETPEFKVMEKSGLYVADPHDHKLSAKEELFMNNLAEKIPVIGKIVAGSERAYVSYLNKMRVDIFSKGRDILEASGKTPENSPQDYKGLASWVNNSTGRGGMSEKMENASPILNSLFFSPRLIASRLNILGLSDVATGGKGFYSKLPKEIRKMVAGDLINFALMGAVVLALSKVNGADVETDPRSSDYGKIKVGDTRYDIWGGFQQYIRFITQMVTGKQKASTSGKITELNGKKAFGKTRADVATSFFRGKLAPIPSMAWDFMQGRTAVGQKTEIGNELLDHFTPLIRNDIQDAWNEQGAKAFFTIGLPATFGIGVQTYTGNKKPIIHPNNKYKTDNKPIKNK